MRHDRRAPRGRPDSRSVARRQTAAGALRSCRRRQGAQQGQARRARARSVALSRTAAGARSDEHRQPGRSDDAADPHVASCKRKLGGGEILVKDEGRLPTGSFKARGLVDGGVDGQGARHQAHGDADQRQCRRRARGLRRAAGIKATIFCPTTRRRSTSARSRCKAHGLSRQRPDRRLRQDRRRGQGASRLVRRLDAEGAVPHRGQEDDGPRTGRAARLGAAGRDLLSDRRRHRPDRHVEGLRRAGSDRLSSARSARAWSRCRRPAARRW